MALPFANINGDDGVLLTLLGIGLLAGLGAAAKTRTPDPEQGLAPSLPPLGDGHAMIAMSGSRPGELQVLGFYDPKTELLETVPGITSQGQAELAALFQPRQQRQISYDPTDAWEW